MCVPLVRLLLRQLLRNMSPMQATVVAMEGAAARWQAQAGEVEQGLALLRFRWAAGIGGMPLMHGVPLPLCCGTDAGLLDMPFVPTCVDLRSIGHVYNVIATAARVYSCRLADLLSEVKWVLEDYSDSEAAAAG